jgi:hypothetical protein
MSDTPPPQVLSVTAAEQALLRAVLREISNEYEAPDAHSDAEAEYAGGLVALAARDLYRAVDAAPREDQPQDWRAKPKPDPRPMPEKVREWYWGMDAVRGRVLRFALEVILTGYADNDPVRAHWQLAFKARDLTLAVNALPPEQRPVGWDGQS